jgi:glycosyltransferase involved in cell wall biosynthesis
MNIFPKGISVIIPCFNREKTIKSAIDSVLNQNYLEKIEVIVSDDGSTDNSLKIARAYAENVMVLEKPKDCLEQGASGARNRALLVAKYEYVCFLDSDDYFLPNYLNTVANILDNNKEIGYTFCRSKKEIRYNDNTTKIEDWTRRKLSSLDKNYHVLYRAYNINTNVIFIRKAVLDKVGLFDTLLSNGNDTDMWLRISEIAKGQFVDIFGAVYRVNHSENQLTFNPNKVRKACATTIYAKSIHRYIEVQSKDKLRLLLIVRLLLYMKMTAKQGLFFSLYRLVTVNCRLLLLFPVTFFKYSFYALKQ